MKEEKAELTFLRSFFCSVVISLGSVAVGYSLTLPDPMLYKLQKVNVPITEFQDGVFRAISSLVGCVGVFVCGILTNHMSYKNTALLFLLCDIIIWLFFWKSFEFNFWWVIFVRSLSGIGMGAFCFIAPQYINRLLIPQKYFFHFRMFIVYGISLGIFLGQLLPVWLDNSWLIVFGCGISVLMGTLMLIFFDPKTQEKSSSQNNSGGSSGDGSSCSDASGNLFSIFQRKYSAKIWLTVGLMCFKQWSGVNTLIVNLTNILRYANIPIPVEISASVASGGLFVGAVINVILMRFVKKKQLDLRTIWIVSIMGSVLTMVMGAKDSPSLLPGCASISADTDAVACGGALSVGMLVDIFLFFVVFTFGMWIITTAIVSGMFREKEQQASVEFISALFNCFFVFLVKLLSSFFINYRYRSFLSFWTWVAGSAVQGVLGLWVMRRTEVEKEQTPAGSSTSTPQQRDGYQQV